MRGGRDARRLLESAGLCAITPDGEADDLRRVVAGAVAGGAGLVQLRHKTMARSQLLSLATEFAPVCRAAGVLLIVNDHLDIALLAGADGVHLGADDLSVESARRVAGAEILIGASASTVESAAAAVQAGADYIGCGPAFATPLKPGKPAIGPEGVAAVMTACRAPVFAIGGIDGGNIARLVAAGVRRACVIRAIAGALDPEAATRALARALA